MELSFPNWQRRPSLRQILETVQRWKTPIDTFLNHPWTRLSVNVLFDQVINGRPLKSYFDLGAVLDLKDAINDVPPHLKPMIGDIVGIVCLLAVMSGNLMELFTGNDAEQYWQKLVQDSHLLLGKSQQHWDDHAGAYKAIFKLLCHLLPGKPKICVRCAAIIFSYIWPNKHSIAQWIDKNWDTIIQVGRCAAIVGAILVALRICKQIYNAICGIE